MLVALFLIRPTYNALEGDIASSLLLNPSVASTLSLGRINICCLSHLKPVGEELSSNGYLSSLDFADTYSSKLLYPVFTHRPPF